MKLSDVSIAIAILVIILLIVLPLAPFLLDVLLVINISLSVLIMLVTLYAKSAMQFSTFPSVLLIVTLFRLALNISSTRLILGNNGDAGNVIHTFGSFVIGDNLVVGLVLFLIIIVIQFIVITKGSERVAEVGARFTLDAMPGKQMAIDADLNAGIIDENQARQRRTGIQKEADFYGAMDGASKFVKGDAIAPSSSSRSTSWAGSSSPRRRATWTFPRSSRCTRARPWATAGGPDPRALDLDFHRHHRARAETESTMGRTSRCRCSRIRWC